MPRLLTRVRDDHANRCLTLSKSAFHADNRWLRSHLQNLLHILISSICSVALVGFVLPALGCSSTSSAKSRPLTAEEQRGRDIFAANCAICHNAYKKEPLQGPPLVGVFRKQELPSGMPATDQHVSDTILLGRRNMPSFHGILNDQEMDELIAFLHTL